MMELIKKFSRARHLYTNPNQIVLNTFYVPGVAVLLFNSLQYLQENKLALVYMI
jgi:hypothetical protein